MQYTANIWILICLQVSIAILFLTLSAFFGFYTFQHISDCYFPCLNEPHCNDATPFNVAIRFKAIFWLGFVTYLVDAVFRLVIVIGLSRRMIYLQLVGAIGANAISAIGQTSLLIVMPIYKNNAAGISCTQPGKPLEL